MLERRAFLFGCACCAAAGLSFAAEAQAPFALPAQTLTPIAEGVWSYTTWTVLNNAPFAANGVVIEGGDKILLVDTGWTDADANAVLDLIAGALPHKPIICVGTHAHADRIGGFNAVVARGIATWAHAMTQQDAPMRHLPLAAQSWNANGKYFALGGRNVEVFYPGPAHTRDNLVAWDERTRTLFGGCMIRDMSWTSLGNVADSNVPAWPDSVAVLQGRYGQRLARLVPGHGTMGGAELLAHTKMLAEAAVARHS